MPHAVGAQEAEMFRPNGADRCQPWELDAWAAAGWPCAPVAFQERNLVQSTRGVHRQGHVPGRPGPRMRLPTAEELERLMGFETGYTVPVLGSSAAKDQPEVFAYSRKSLLDNSMSCWVCGYILGCLAHEMGYLVRPPTRAELRLAGDHPSGPRASGHHLGRDQRRQAYP